MVNIQEIRKNKLIEDFKLNNKIDLNTIKYKFISIRTHSNKKVCLTYERLNKPKITYYLTDGIYLFEINKTIYNYLKDIPEDLTKLEIHLKDFINLNLFERFKDKDYLHLNFLNNTEKQSITLTKLYFNKDYKEMLKIINGE